uniref:Putative secreted protein n=1 Tax=Anopheles darlingi TaxID=43151 RepID=A0A2M4DA64_ANODA
MTTMTALFVLALLLLRLRHLLICFGRERFFEPQSQIAITVFLFGFAFFGARERVVEVGRGIAIAHRFTLVGVLGVYSA